MPRYPLAILVALLAAACGSTPDHPFPVESVVVGEVEHEDGSPASGIFVTSWPTDSAYSVSVTTNDAGEFAVPLLRPNSSALTAHGLGVETVSASDVGTDVGTIRIYSADTRPRIPSSRFLARLPDGETKRRFILDCTGCHQFDRQIVELNGQPRPRDSWVERINQMLSFSGASSQFPVMSPSRKAEETADWLLAHLGDTQNSERTEGSLVVSPRDDRTVGRATITEYPIPEQADLPHDIAVDGRGHVIVTGMFTHLLYDLNPETGRFERIPIPVDFANPRAVEIDAAGTWWSLLGFPRKIARYEPDTETWSAFDIGMYPHSIVPDADGTVWFNGHFTKDPELIGRLDPESGEVETFRVPVSSMSDGGSNIPYGLRIGPDGTLWGTELVGNRLIKFKDGMFSIYPLPTPFSGPRRPDVAADGTVWIPEYANNRLAAFDPTLETFTEHELPVRDALPYIVRFHPNSGHVWVASAAADAVFSFNPEIAEFTTYNLPTPRSLIRHMAVDRETDGVWVAYGNSPSVTPKIARIEPW